MNITMLKSKIHRAVVTQAELNYVGSITVDSELLKEAGILEYEMVQTLLNDTSEQLLAQELLQVVKRYIREAEK